MTRWHVEIPELEKAQPDLQILSCKGEWLLPTICDIDGLLVGSGNIAPDLLIDLNATGRAQDCTAARQVFEQLLPVTRALYHRGSHMEGTVALNIGLRYSGLLDHATIREPLKDLGEAAEREIEAVFDAPASAESTWQWRPHINQNVCPRSGTAGKLEENILNFKGLRLADSRRLHHRRGALLTGHPEPGDRAAGGPFLHLRLLRSVDHDAAGHAGLIRGGSGGKGPDPQDPALGIWLFAGRVFRTLRLCLRSGRSGTRSSGPDRVQRPVPAGVDRALARGLRRLGADPWRYRAVTSRRIDSRTHCQTKVAEGMVWPRTAAFFQVYD